MEDVQTVAGQHLILFTSPLNCFLSAIDLDQAIVGALQPVEKEVKPRGPDPSDEISNHANGTSEASNTFEWSGPE